MQITRFLKASQHFVVRDPYNADSPLAQTITCTSSTWHYTGKRPCTLREVACLQGFPLDHKFGKQSVRKQIGNAAPPVVMNVIFRHIMEKLRDTDNALRKSTALAFK